MRGWVAGVFSVLLLCALLPLSLLAFTPGSELRRSGASRFVADTDQPQRLRVGTNQVPASAESGILDGNAVVLAVPPSVIRAIRPVGAPTRATWLREVVTPSGSEEADLPQVTLRSSTSVGVSLHAFYGREVITLEPAMIELPDDAAPGKRWSSSGRVVTADGAGEYDNESTARPGGDGCLVVESRTRLRLSAETRRTDVATWCPNRGIVDGTPTLGQARRQFSGAWPMVGGTSERAPFEPVSGQVTRPEVLVDRPGGGTEPWRRDVDRKRLPVVTTSGTAFSVGQLTQDVAAHRVVGDSLRANWWGLPGGSVQGLTAVGDTVVVTTSDRRLVGYADSGRRLWSNRISDLAPQGAVALGPDRVVLATLSGRVEAYDLANGRRIWSAEVDDGVTGRPWVLDDTVYVARKGGAGLAALAADSGEQRWTNDDLSYELVGLARDGDTLLAGTATGAMLLMEASTGKSLSTAIAGYGDRPRRLTPGPDPRVVAMQTDKGLILLRTATSEVVAELPEVLDAVSDRAGWWVLESGALRQVDNTGAELRRITVDAKLTSGARLHFGADRVWLIDQPDADLTVWWIR
ncbi:PQQ-binding-like beta-propeller repeat protein [Naumannella sp. ID2617S]|nr:PQQ-binding-like beta-propeller repeat protein [Naumannella sp. ID2617S]